jgi:4-amino-4-deoxy-L-arabinose transferase-like glycosyltransferase
LRTYHFHDWLLFNPDQARDAKVVDDIVNGRSSWLVLGPEAGNTRFQLGPWTYHLEAISAKIFGSSPDTMAYPDLLFSILSIPLFFVFLKKYFGAGLSLALTGLYSFSFFAIRYSRFAWNPNSIPFFVLVFLLGLLHLLEPEKKKSFWGAALVGVGIGIGMQLHILLLFIMLSVAGLFFLFLFFRRTSILPKFEKIGIVLLLIFLTNIGQIAFEMKNGSYNIRKFVRSTAGFTVEMKLGENLKKDFLCFSKANFHIVTSLGNGDGCDSPEILAEYYANKRVFLDFPENKLSIELIAVGCIFTLAGFILLAIFWRRETDQRKRNFLALAGIYGLTVFLVMFPVIDQAEPRYFIVSSFLPFVFLGLMADGLLCFRSLWTKIAIVAVFAWLLYLNAATEIKAAEIFFSKKANDANFIFLGETEDLADYFLANANGSKTIYLRGERDHEKRYFKPLNYILARRGIDLAHPASDEGESVPGAPTYFVVKNRYGKYKVGSKIGGYSRVGQMIKFNDTTIIVPTEDETN